MKTKMKILVTFVPINELNFWTQPITYSDGPQHRPSDAQSQKRTSLVPQIKKHTPSQVKHVR